MYMAQKEQARLLNYTPTPAEMFGQGEIGVNIKIPPQIRKLASQCILPFSENSANTGTVKGDNRLRVFEDGKEPRPVIDNSHRFERAAEQLIANNYGHYFTSEGTIKPEYKQAWSNVTEIAPSLIKILSDRLQTDRPTYISMIQEDYALNLIATALFLIDNPDADIKILMGIGGSDDEFTTSRFVSYALPALEMAEALADFYQERDQAKQLDAAVKKRLEEFLATPEAQALSPDDLKKRKREIAQITDPSQILTEGDIVEIRRTYAIRTTPAKIEFKFAHHAAQTVNSTMDKDKIIARAGDNITALRKFVDTCYPNLSDNVNYIEDKPWQEHSLYGRMLLEYMASLLRESDDPVIKSTLATLQDRGKNHGGNDGAERAAEYAAAHPIIFEDRLSVPATNTFDDGRKADLLITIGGRPERHFNAIRNFLSKNVTSDGLIRYVLTKAAQTTDETERLNLQRLAQRIQRWEEIITHTRAGYRRGTRTVRADLPIHELLEITTLGEAPTYYASKFDRPDGTPLSTQIPALLIKIKRLEYQRLLNKDDALLVNNLSEEITEARRVLSDLRKLFRSYF